MNSVQRQDNCESCPVVAHNSPRFDIDDPEQARGLLSYLEEHGYCVVASVASAEDIERAKTLFWDAAEDYRPGLKRNDTSTWDDDNWLANPATGIIFGRPFNHSDFLWNTRLLPKVRRAFQLVWSAETAAAGDDGMLVSFDGGNAFRPWALNPLWATTGGWWHVDQNARNPNRTGRICVQGLVTYTDAGPAAGGLCVIPGSHRHHDALCARAPGARVSADFVPVPEGDPLIHGAAGRLVCAAAGDLILWDSRTVHCNTPALCFGAPAPAPAAGPAGASPPASAPASCTAESCAADPFAAEVAPPPPAAAAAAAPAELLRLVAYVCMVPRQRVPAETLAARRSAFERWVPTSHWPDRAPPVPRPGAPDGRGPPPRDPAACPPEMLALVGYPPHDDPARPADGGPEGRRPGWGVSGCAVM